MCKHYQMYLQNKMSFMCMLIRDANYTISISFTSLRTYIKNMYTSVIILVYLKATFNQFYKMFDG